VLLANGWWQIRHGRREWHRWSMLAACLTSALFLASYLVYHFEVGSVRFTGQGPMRVVYFAVLISHTLLAAVIVPLVLVTLKRALSARFEAHRTLARYTLPLWLYVSVTGVVVYWMLYRL
jgi:putative membrane protein